MNIDFFQCSTRAEVLSAIAPGIPALVAFEPKRVTESFEKDAKTETQPDWSRPQDVVCLGELLSGSRSTVETADLIGRSLSSCKAKRKNFFFLLSGGKVGMSNYSELDKEVYKMYRADPDAFWAEYRAAVKSFRG